MGHTTVVKHYSPLEEGINVSSHALGLLLSIAALVALLELAIGTGNAWQIVSYSIFGGSLIITYLSSTLYHSTKNPVSRSRLRILDHASIYILIAGSYTPFTLVTLQGTPGWIIFGISWGMAVMGITLKLFFTGRYPLLSTLTYVFMGWIILFAIAPLVEKLHPIGLRWLVAGGVAYSLGAVMYGIKRIPFGHAIFHVFTLLGSVCHFMAVYFYVN